MTNPTSRRRDPLAAPSTLLAVLGVFTALAAFTAGLASPASAEETESSVARYAAATESSASGLRFSDSLPSRYRVAVDKSVDPDGFLLKEEYRNTASTVSPPSCVDARDAHPAAGLATVTVKNNCPVPQRVKVLIAFWFDSACLIVQPRSSVDYDYANSARFDGLVSC